MATEKHRGHAHDRDGNCEPEPSEGRTVDRAARNTCVQPCTNPCPDRYRYAELLWKLSSLRGELQAVKRVEEDWYQTWKRVNEERDAAEADRDVLADALRNQGLLQNTATGVVWHVHDCAASFDFAECNYRCRVAREAFALVGTEPYILQETRRDTEVYE